MKTDKLKQRWYKPERLDNDQPFRRMINESIRSDTRVLDAGAGAGDLFDYDLKDRVREMIGVDLNPRVESNPLLHRGVRADLTVLPFPDQHFDMVFSRYVLEHIGKPESFLHEVHRVLKPGGRFLFLTPNKWHYVSLASRLTPGRFHAWYNARLRKRREDDTFPTLYRLNTTHDLRRHLQQMGFVCRRMVLRECCPNYLLFSWPAFLLGVAYERLVNTTELLAHLRVNILGCFEKL